MKWLFKSRYNLLDIAVFAVQCGAYSAIYHNSGPWWMYVIVMLGGWAFAVPSGYYELKYWSKK